MSGSRIFRREFIGKLCGGAATAVVGQGTIERADEPGSYEQAGACDDHGGGWVDVQPSREVHAKKRAEKCVYESEAKYDGEALGNEMGGGARKDEHSDDKDSPDGLEGTDHGDGEQGHEPEMKGGDVDAEGNSKSRIERTNNQLLVKQPKN